MVIFSIPSSLNLAHVCETPEQPQAAILQDDRIDELAALHAASGHEIEVAIVGQEVETLFGHHQASAARTPRRADEFHPLGYIAMLQIIYGKFECGSH
jgi:hypothetical protein